MPRESRDERRRNGFHHSYRALDDLSRGLAERQCAFDAGAGGDRLPLRHAVFDNLLDALQLGRVVQLLDERADRRHEPAVEGAGSGRQVSH
jgi:hypothetical protein